MLEISSSLSGIREDQISASDIERFAEIWSQFDTSAEAKIATELLPQLVMELPPPMGVGRHANLRQVRLSAAVTTSMSSGQEVWSRMPSCG